MPFLRSGLRAAGVTSAALLAAWAAGCSAVNYSQDYDPEAVIGARSTWNFRPPTPAQRAGLDRISPFLQRRIEREVEIQLESKGFRRDVVDAPELLVAAYPILPDLRQCAASGPPHTRVQFLFGVGPGRPIGRAYRYPYWSWGPGFEYWGPAFSHWNPHAWYVGTSWGWGAFPFEAYYHPGGYRGPFFCGADERHPDTLVIDVIEVRSGRVVWQGLAEGALLDMPGAAGLEEYMSKVVGRILSDFPPNAEPGEAPHEASSTDP